MTFLKLSTSLNCCVRLAFTGASAWPQCRHQIRNQVNNPDSLPILVKPTLGTCFCPLLRRSNMQPPGTFRTAAAKPRTVILHQHPSITALSVGDRILTMLDHLPPRIRSIIVCITHLECLSSRCHCGNSCCPGRYLLRQAPPTVSTRLVNRSLDNSTAILTAPYKVSLGDRLPVDELCDYLRATGYQRRPTVFRRMSFDQLEVDGDADNM